ncbi:MAG: hypothetical protein Q4G68_12680 [Planctomycetia bacterium]|nr:hypothetical protein [Planctomycetia bacterium]
MKCRAGLLGVLISCLFLPLSAWCEEDLVSAEGLLVRCDRALCKTATSRMVVETTEESVIPGDVQFPEQTWHFQLLRSNTLFRLEGEHTNNNKLQDQSDTYFLSTIDDHASVDYRVRNGEEAPQGASFSSNIEQAQQYCVYGTSYGFWLDGMIGFTGTDNIAAYLMKAGACSLEPDEVIDGISCKVIAAKTPYGTFRLWLDPAVECLFRKIEIHKGPSDKGKPRSDDAFTEVDICLDQITIDSVQGSPLLTAGTYSWEGTEKGGGLVQCKVTARRSDIDLSPAFHEKDFVSELPAGTDIINLDDRDSGVQYVWDGKKPVAGYASLFGSPQRFAGNYLRLILMAVGFALILISVSIKIRKRRFS